LADQASTAGKPHTTSYETIIKGVRQASKYMSRRNASAPQLEAAFTYLSAVVDGEVTRLDQHAETATIQKALARR
jgi:hypothetical protein